MTTDDRQARADKVRRRVDRAIENHGFVAMTVMPDELPTTEAELAAQLVESSFLAADVQGDTVVVTTSHDDGPPYHGEFRIECGGVL